MQANKRSQYLLFLCCGKEPSNKADNGLLQKMKYLKRIMQTTNIYLGTNTGTLSYYLINFKNLDSPCACVFGIQYQ